MGGSCKVGYISSKCSIDNARLQGTLSYGLKNIYLKYVTLMSSESRFTTIAIRGAFSVVKKLLPERMAFTLAEVLIVLGIIGLIADMTIPTLMNNVQNAQLEAAFKTAYSTISQAMTTTKLQEGQIYGVYGDYYADAEKSFAYVLSKNFRNPVFPTTRGVWEKNYKTFAGGTAGLELRGFFDDGAFYIPNGMTLFFEAPNPSVLYISIDVNGHLKKPNRWGYDLFSFALSLDDVLVPAGSSRDPFQGYSDLSKYCNYSSADGFNGVACSQRALTEKDYFKNLK